MVRVKHEQCFSNYRNLQSCWLERLLLFLRELEPGGTFYALITATDSGLANSLARARCDRVVWLERRVPPLPALTIFRGFWLAFASLFVLVVVPLRFVLRTTKFLGRGSLVCGDWDSRFLYWANTPFLLDKIRVRVHPRGHGPGVFLSSNKF